MTSFGDLHKERKSVEQGLRDRHRMLVRGTGEGMRVPESAPGIPERKIMRVTSRRRRFPCPVSGGIELHVVTGIPVVGFRRAGSAGAVNGAARVVRRVFGPEPGPLNVHGASRMGV